MKFKSVSIIFSVFMKEISYANDNLGRISSCVFQIQREKIKRKERRSKIY